jgi:hypothetical protein
LLILFFHAVLLLIIIIIIRNAWIPRQRMVRPIVVVGSTYARRPTATPCARMWFCLTIRFDLARVDAVDRPCRFVCRRWPDDHKLSHGPFFGLITRNGCYCCCRCYCRGRNGDVLAAFIRRGLFPKCHWTADRNARLNSVADRRNHSPSCCPRASCEQQRNKKQWASEHCHVDNDCRRPVTFVVPICLRPLAQLALWPSLRTSHSCRMFWWN